MEMKREFIVNIWNVVNIKHTMMRCIFLTSFLSLVDSFVGPSLLVGTITCIKKSLYLYINIDKLDQ